MAGDKLPNMFVQYRDVLKLYRSDLGSWRQEYRGRSTP
jgi:hypothetical protein